MPIQRLIRYGTGFVFIALVSACSSPDSGRSASSPWSAVQAAACRASGSCMYEGRYESGERAYAEQAARRLNQASLERLQSRSLF